MGDGNSLDSTVASCGPTDWIEIELVGEDDLGVADQVFVVILPDGSRQQGKTDADGLGRIEGIPSGTCQVSFPDLDQDAWEPLG